MSNNEPDYDNLAFDPSALNPCNDGKRGSDVLTATLEKCQAIVAKNVELEKENTQLKELLYSLKCCLTSENIEPQIRVEKSLAKIKEFLTYGYFLFKMENAND